MELNKDNDLSGNNETNDIIKEQLCTEFKWKERKKQTKW